jgi:hypothetical protein
MGLLGGVVVVPELDFFSLPRVLARLFFICLVIVIWFSSGLAFCILLWSSV